MPAPHGHSITRSQVTTLMIRLHHRMLRLIDAEPPRNVTFVALDIVEFARRAMVDQLELRKSLFAAVRVIKQRLGHLITYDVLERGDGVLLLLPHDLDLRELLRTALPGVADVAARGRAGGMRLRCVIHKGPVQRDKWGWVGEELNLVFRLIDSDELRRRLRKADARLVVALTQSAHADLLALHDQDERELQNFCKSNWDSEIEECRLAAKETTVDAWVATVAGRPAT